jgi:hypothetical protein
MEYKTSIAIIVLVYLLNIAIFIGLNVYILTLTLSMFNKGKNKTEHRDDLSSLQQDLQTWISIDIIVSLISAYRSYQKSNKFSFVSSIIQVAISVNYLIMVQHTTESYKNKKYDKALTFVTIVLVLDIISCILAFVEFTIEIKESLTPVYYQYKLIKKLNNIQKNKK